MIERHWPVCLLAICLAAFATPRLAYPETTAGRPKEITYEQAGIVVGVPDYVRDRRNLPDYGFPTRENVERQQRELEGLIVLDATFTSNEQIASEPVHSLSMSPRLFSFIAEHPDATLDERLGLLAAEGAEAIMSTGRLTYPQSVRTVFDEGRIIGRALWVHDSEGLRVGFPITGHINLVSAEGALSLRLSFLDYDASVQRELSRFFDYEIHENGYVTTSWRSERSKQAFYDYVIANDGRLPDELQEFVDAWHYLVEHVRLIGIGEQ